MELLLWLKHLLLVLVTSMERIGSLPFFCEGAALPPFTVALLPLAGSVA